MIDRSKEFDSRFNALDRDFVVLLKKEKQLLREIKKLEMDTDKKVEQSKKNEIKEPKLLALTIEGKKKTN